jgi:hypothetical protein
MIAAFISSLGLVPINTWRMKSGKWKVERVEWTNDVAAGSVDLYSGKKKELCQVAPCYMIATFISSLGLVPISTLLHDRSIH